MADIASVRRFAAAFTFACVLAFALTAAPASAEGKKTAVFPFEWISSSLETQRDDEIARIKMVDAQLRDLLAASGAYTPLDLAPAAEAIANARKFSDCRGCAEEIARTLGAEVAVTAWIQKVSNLILNINVVISDAKTGQLIAAGSADIRGNTDESWRRGLEWLGKHRLVHQ